MTTSQPSRKDLAKYEGTLISQLRRHFADAYISTTTERKIGGGFKANTLRLSCYFKGFGLLGDTSVLVQNIASDADAQAIVDALIALDYAASDAANAGVDAALIKSVASIGLGLEGVADATQALRSLTRQRLSETAYVDAS